MCKEAIFDYGSCPRTLHSTIQLADNIIVMKEGRVVEEGSFSNLIDKKGFFAGLVAHQMSPLGDSSASSIAPQNEDKLGQQLADSHVAGENLRMAALSSAFNSRKPAVPSIKPSHDSDSESDVTEKRSSEQHDGPIPSKVVWQRWLSCLAGQSIYFTPGTIISAAG